MATINVSNSTQLNSAINSSVGGDVIVLANGNYGTLDVTVSKTSPVTIKAATKNGATFNSIDVSGSAYLTFDGIKNTGSVILFNNAHHIKFANSTFGQVEAYQGGTHDIDIVDSDLASVILGGYGTQPVYNINILRSKLHESGDLLFMAGDVHHVLCEGNEFFDIIAESPEAHPDFIQGLMDFETGKTPHDITIRKNWMHDLENTGAIGTEGIFLSDAGSSGYRNILIEENVIQCTLYNGITIHSGTVNVMIRNNSLSYGRIWVCNNQGYGNAGTTVKDNIVPAMLNDGGGSTVIHNLEAGPETAFVNFVDGSSIEQFRPKQTYIDQGYGALSFFGATQPPIEEPPTMADTLTLTAVTIANTSVMGTVSIANNKVHFVPKAGFQGVASGTYTARDTANQSATSTWTVTVLAPPNPPPVLVADSATVPFGTAFIDLDVIANDTA